MNTFFEEAIEQDRVLDGCHCAARAVCDSQLRFIHIRSDGRSELVSQRMVELVVISPTMTEADPVSDLLEESAGPGRLGHDMSGLCVQTFIPIATWDIAM